MILTMQGGLLYPISWLFGKVMDIIYNILAVDGVANLGICIILFTVVVKLILLPMNMHSQKTSKVNQIIQPEIQKIQKKYKNKTDNESMLKQNQEINAVYRKYGTSMTAGCLPMFIQFPIIFGLYDVVRNIPAYVSSIKELYIPIADSIINHLDDYKTVLTEFVNEHKISTATAYVQNFGTTGNANNEVIDVLGTFSTTQWNEFLADLAGNTDITSVINMYLPKINEINEFMFGINISEAPGLKLSLALLIPIISTVFQLISMKVSMNHTKKQGGEQNEMANSMMKSMMFMPIMSFFMCVFFPSGLGLYWAANSVISLFIQIGITYYYDHVANLDKILDKMAKKAAKKNSKNGGKKSFMERMMEAQGEANTDSPMSAQISNKNLRNYDTRNMQSINNTGKKYKEGSMASKANIMLNYDDVKGRDK